MEQDITHFITKLYVCVKNQPRYIEPSQQHKLWKLHKLTFYTCIIALVGMRIYWLLLIFLCASHKRNLQETSYCSLLLITFNKFILLVGMQKHILNNKGN